MSPLMPDDTRKKYYAWRKRTNKGIPALANRIFALRGKTYSGCGFHYGMEQQLGALIRSLNDYDTIPTLGSDITLELHAEMLYQSVREAELSAAGAAQ